MRLLVISCLLLLLLCSCGGTEENSLGPSDQIEVSLDTVLVDAGEEFLFLQFDLFISALSPDQSYLINFNPESLEAEWIDLNELELIKKVQFEKEGPNGLGPYLGSFSIREDEQLLFQNYMSYKLFDQEGTLKKDLGLEKIAKDYLGSTEYYPVSIFEPAEDRILVLALKWEDYTYSFLDIDMESETYTVIDLDHFEKNKDYRVEVTYEGNPAGGFGPSITPRMYNNQILMNTGAFNEVVILDLDTDSLSVKSWDTPVLGAKRTYVPPKQLEMTSSEMKEVRRKYDEDLAYSPFLWDEANERYLRFSQKKIFSEELDEYEEYVSTGARVYLSIFDSDLNLVKEAELPSVKKLPYKHFVKDGMVWMYENVDDELAFVRLKIE
ncbi:DUF4221 family protein [Algoriphagus namhaensis]